VIETLHTAIAAVMDTDAMRDTLIKQGMDPLLLGPKELAALIKTESANWAKVIKTAGIRLE
jgi:tripartite-type tricarboxylate transporter receptor subunit TctC